MTVFLSIIIGLLGALVLICGALLYIAIGTRWGESGNRD